MADLSLAAYELDPRHYIHGLSQVHDPYLANQGQIDYSYLHSMHPSSSTTPMAQQRDDVRRTRSGRPIGPQARTASPHDYEAPAPRAASPKRRTKKTKTTQATQPLHGPLSIITRDMTEVPVRDMHAWVNRSVETRQDEVRQRKGYITRPMNSFMLYRSAYAERTKAWCKENNHQVVSSVSGQSWPLEPPEVRNEFNELAKTERSNHQLAHPDYKFSPAKPKVENKKRKGDAEGHDSDADWAQANHPSSRRRLREGRDASYPARSAPSVPQTDRAGFTVPEWTGAQTISQNYSAVVADQLQAYTDASVIGFTRVHNPVYGQVMAEFYPTGTDNALPYFEAEHYLQQQVDPNHQQHPQHQHQYLHPTSAYQQTFGLPGGIYHEINQIRSTATTPASAVDPGLGGQYAMQYPLVPSQHHHVVPSQHALQQHHHQQQQQQQQQLLGYGELPPPRHAVTPLPTEPVKHTQIPITAAPAVSYHQAPVQQASIAPRKVPTPTVPAAASSNTTHQHAANVSSAPERVAERAAVWADDNNIPGLGNHHDDGELDQYLRELASQNRQPNVDSQANKTASNSQQGVVEASATEAVDDEHDDLFNGEFAEFDNAERYLVRETVE